MQSKRAANGYRIYDDSAVEELSLVKYVRDLGLPLSEIKRLIDGCKERDCQHTGEYVRDEISGYMGILDKKIEELNRLKSKLTMLQKSIKVNKKYCRDGNKYCCNILKMIEELPKGGD